jgi:outer membrane putative beta-barrel porin/alpha-amylase
MNLYRMVHALGCALAIVTTFAVLPAVAQQSEGELAKEALNPVAALISLPIKYDYNSNIGPAEQGNQSLLTVQPVIPFSIGADWNLISRTIIQAVSLDKGVPGAGTPDGLGDVATGSGTQEGLGDITQQVYFSPKTPTDAGWIWGVGPQILLPTGASDLTAGKWGAGPTAVVLKQENGWTYGALVNQIWSVSSDSHRSDYSVFYVQPFLAYTTKTYTTVGINTESTYNWKASQWSVPVNLTLTQILKLGNQPLSLQVGARYWADTPEGIGPKGWGYRFQLTLLFPKAR